MKFFVSKIEMNEQEVKLTLDPHDPEAAAGEEAILIIKTNTPGAALIRRCLDEEKSPIVDLSMEATQ